MANPDFRDLFSALSAADLLDVENLERRRRE